MEERKDQKRPQNERPKLEYTDKKMEVLNALSQINGENYHGAVDKDGNTVDKGLRSDNEGMPYGHNGKQQLDGFNFQLFSDIMVLKYHTDATTREVHSKGKGKYEQEIRDTMMDNIKFIKERFHSITGKSLSLTPIDDEPFVEFSYMNAHRSWVAAVWKFKVGNLKDVGNKELDGDRYDDVYGMPSQKLNESFDMASWIRSIKDDKEDILAED